MPQQTLHIARLTLVPLAVELDSDPEVMGDVADLGYRLLWRHWRGAGAGLSVAGLRRAHREGPRIEARVVGELPEPDVEQRPLLHDVGPAECASPGGARLQRRGDVGGECRGR